MYLKNRAGKGINIPFLCRWTPGGLFAREFLRWLVNEGFWDCAWSHGGPEKTVESDIRQAGCTVTVDNDIILGQRGKKKRR